MNRLARSSSSHDSNMKVLPYDTMRSSDLDGDFLVPATSRGVLVLYGHPIKGYFGFDSGLDLSFNFDIDFNI
jgi:hypothetical protein